MCVFYCVSKNVTPIFHFGLIFPISSYTVPSLDPIYFYDLSDWCDYVNACGIGNYNNNISNYFIWIESKNAVIFFLRWRQSDKRIEIYTHFAFGIFRIRADIYLR